MGLTDMFKSKKYNKIFDQVWKIVWPRFKQLPEEETAEQEFHLVFVGTLLYAARVNAALVAGMQETVAKTVALKILSGANYDKEMEDEIIFIFSEEKTAEYANRLNAQLRALAEKAKNEGTLRTGPSVEGYMEEIETLRTLLREQLSRED
ncbi:MAG: hypothetical protein C0616_11310 [Desulfuromonas sp.]|nr:MAG: hypothetical protein C0616_11310 [Desulfuromonas sp.]